MSNPGAPKSISITATNHKEFRRLKFEYQMSLKIQNLSDSEYLLRCARVVDKSIKTKQEIDRNE